ncbi:MAG: MRP family ATP-binding protein [Proteobacteria bacterium]|nr:MRP family ATP-binding protein [Pseudomonadota bacterium]
MSGLDSAKILQNLREIRLPKGANDIVSEGLVSGVTVKDGTVGFVLDIGKTVLTREEAEALRATCETRVRAIEGVKQAMAVLTAPRTGSVRVEAKSAPKGGVQPPSPTPLAGVKRIIAVGSGKGGVGKSTVASNLAVALAKLGFKTGLVDADIHGPSVAKMMGISGEPEVKDNRMVPLERHGVKCMSMGLLLKENVPVVWRGPMVTKALHQLMRGAHWDNLDYLIIDLPPGTGDIHISIAQNFVIDGIVMVTTPQEVALLDVKKALSMFEKLRIPTLGIIENMSYFSDANGQKQYLFGQGGGKRLAKEFHVDLLGEIAIDPAVSESGDSGTPIAAKDGNAAALSFKAIAKTLADTVRA